MCTRPTTRPAAFERTPLQRRMTAVKDGTVTVEWAAAILTAAAQLPLETWLQKTSMRRDRLEALLASVEEILLDVQRTGDSPAEAHALAQRPETWTVGRAAAVIERLYRLADGILERDWRRSGELKALANRTFNLWLAPFAYFSRSATEGELSEYCPYGEGSFSRVRFERLNNRSLLYSGNPTEVRTVFRFLCMPASLVHPACRLLLPDDQQAELASCRNAYRERLCGPQGAGVLVRNARERYLRMLDELNGGPCPRGEAQLWEFDPARLSGTQTGNADPSPMRPLYLQPLELIERSEARPRTVAGRPGVLERRLAASQNVAPASCRSKRRR